ncbi:MAG TPA: GNAT family N-acetyltransferase [Actinocrinis sp.]|jgi:CelD/BcsL family acetyltransferase involved in cellulose biosynthesis|uniref:GNAT family N-acetyltransferase n=1 Tax=Actinocrinis sp. TaxID=1920516 RepID=UPI002DDD945B|nr:GNAT family N-acetyltransferase [Actinocrinis sp.]HEV3170273.1 GNAT family N-acetyltransferase [Actinocrinis sp.]
MGDVEVFAEFGDGALSAPWWDGFAVSQGTAFHASRFLLPWWRDRLAKNPESRLVTARVVDDEDIVGICAFEVDADLLSFAGGRDVVDYMGPIAIAGREKEVAAALGEWMFDGLPWSRAHLAGLVNDDAAAQAMIDEALRRAPSAVAGTYDQAPRIDEAPQGYLAGLNSKRRADVLRKRNRLIEAVGELELVASTPETVLDLLERLLAWKACASAATSGFVADYGGFLRAVLTELAAADTGHVVELRASGRPLASAIMLRHRDTAYIYNMSYDMSLTAESGLAPGVVLVSLLVERSLDSGLRFDFLKGAQDYKLRLGGVPVDLTAVAVER